MPLSRKTFQTLAQTVMGVAGDVPDLCTFRKVAYDANGQPTGGFSALVSVRALRESLALEKVDNSAVLLSDRQYLIAAKDLGSVTPEEDDTLEVDGAVWTVKRVETDPAGATHRLLVRK